MKPEHTNAMGSTVSEGYRCKPVKSDPQRPVLRYKHHILVCSGARCEGVGGGEVLADTLRDLTDDMDLKTGEKRVKVSRSACLGACRFKSVLLVYQNGADAANNCVWLKESQTLDREALKELLRTLADNTPLGNTGHARRLIPME